MIKDLILIRIKSMLPMSIRGKLKAMKGKKILFGILAAYLAVCFGSLFGMLFSAICEPFASLGLSWLYFGIMGLLVFALCFIGSVFVTQNQIYEAKDNDLLLSMPIPVHKILISRLVSIIFLNYLYEVFIVVPAAMVYCIHEQVTVMGITLFVLACLLLPILVMTFSVLFGWLIALISSHMRNPKIVTTALTMVFFATYMVLCLQLQKYIDLLAQSGETISDVIRKGMPPFYYMGTAIADGNITAFFLFVLMCAIPFTAVCFLLKKSFIRITTTKKGAKKKEYRARRLKTSGIKQALFKKELAHFLGNPMYIFNSALGLVFLVAGGIYLMVKSDFLTSMVIKIGGNELVGPLICIIMGALSCMTIISSCTISIDGKIMWITQSSPIKPKDALLAKANLHIYVSLPFVLIAVVLAEIAVPMSALSRVLVFCFPIVLTMFNAYTGVILNLKFPKFDWINETDAIKQALAPFLAMFVSFSAVLLPCLLYGFFLHLFLSAEIYATAVLIIFAAATAMLYKYLITKGAVMYQELQG